MATKVIKIDTHIPVIPEWLKISKTFSFKIPLKTARELAKKLEEVQDDVDVEINFNTGKEVQVEIKYEPKTAS
jgi:hypothetical protein